MSVHLLIVSIPPPPNETFVSAQPAGHPNLFGPRRLLFFFFLYFWIGSIKISANWPYRAVPAFPDSHHTATYLPAQQRGMTLGVSFFLSTLFANAEL